MIFRIILYRVLLLPLVPIAFLWSLFSRRHRQTLKARFGLGDGWPEMKGGIHVHAVSVGEVLAARPLVKELRRAFPHRPLTISTVTQTGQSLALDFHPETVYFPVDLSLPIKHFFEGISPALVILVETEIWPNFTSHCRARKIPILLVNGRLSDQSFKGYRRMRWFWRPFFGALEEVLAQSEADGERFRELGAAEVSVVGNVKFDFTPPELPDEVTDLFASISSGRQGWAAGSTMPGEEELVLQAHREIMKTHPGALLLLAPRHPERVADVERLCIDEGFSCLRRTVLSTDQKPDIVLLDTLGELATLYRYFPVVFVGGSLVPTGGHNVIEPASWGCAVAVGPYMDNFRAIAASFEEEGALTRVTTETLAGDILRLISDPSTTGDRARNVVNASRGALGATVEKIGELLP